MGDREAHREQRDGDGQGQCSRAAMRRSRNRVCCVHVMPLERGSGLRCCVVARYPVGCRPVLCVRLCLLDAADTARMQVCRLAFPRHRPGPSPRIIASTGAEKLASIPAGQCGSWHSRKRRCSGNQYGQTASIATAVAESGTVRGRAEAGAEVGTPSIGSFSSTGCSSATTPPAR